MKRNVTILTDEIPNFKILFGLLFKLAQKTKYIILNKPLPRGSVYGGHFGVTRSLISGMQKQKYLFNYNPNFSFQLSKTVIVLSDIKALKQVLRLKKVGKINKIIAGPNLVTFPSEFDGIIADNGVDVCIVPSIWVKKNYEADEPKLIHRIQTWYAGVDESYWEPNSILQKDNVLIYWKTEDKNFYQDIKNTIEKYDYKVTTIKYGQYNESEYKKALSRSLFSVFISRSESQGIALAESWSMGVPTVVWNIRGDTIINHKLVKNISACPYLTSENGLEFSSLDELEDIVHRFKSDGYTNLKPREWVLKNMTDRNVAQSMINIIESTNSK
jgi:hypothetical protein